MNFEQLGIIDPILKALQQQGYKVPTPIQQKAIPILLKNNDLLGCAQTGTGKTAAFAIPIIQQIYENHRERSGIKALIVTPTRELAMQIGESFREYGKYTRLKHTVIFGGVSQHSQVMALKSGVDILVATPGRLLDLMEQGYINLNQVKYFVLDEADRMLDMGFIHDVKKIIKIIPDQRQSLFFSATLPPSIIELSGKILRNAESVTIKPEQTTAEKVAQRIYFVEKTEKPNLLLHLLQTENMSSTLIFTRTKYGADKIVKFLNKSGIKSGAIHSDKSQAHRQKALDGFREGKFQILVATDIASRGLDLEELTHVLNYDLPNQPETYVHRIGRTGRASASGEAFSFCDTQEKSYLKGIEKWIRQPIPVTIDHPFNHVVTAAPAELDATQAPAISETKPERKTRKYWRRNRARSKKKMAVSV